MERKKRSSDEGEDKEDNPEEIKKLKSGKETSKKEEEEEQEEEEEEEGGQEEEEEAEEEDPVRPRATGVPGPTPAPAHAPATGGGGGGAQGQMPGNIMQVRHLLDSDVSHAGPQQLLHAMLIGGRGGANTNDELVDHLKNSGALTDDRVEEAMRHLPRHLCVPSDLEDDAYNDSPMRLPTFGFNISAPHMYAVCLENMDIQPGSSVLDVGFGCGLLTMMCSYLAGKDGYIHGLDLRKDILDFAQKNTKRMSEHSGVDFSNIHYEIRNCFLPALKARTYDRIHVGACTPEGYLDKLLELLAPNGILVTPLDDRLVKVTKDAAGKTKVTKLMAVRYGDLIVPSDAEVKDAQLALERVRATTVLVPEDSYMNDFSRLCCQEDMHDVTLVVEGKKIPAHRVILGARCAHFHAMFYNGLRESRQEEITLPDLPYEPFLDLLRYLYQGKLQFKSPDQAIDLLPVANYFKIDRLVALCEDNIKNHIEIENAAYILQVAVRNEASQLKSVALDFVLRNYDKVTLTKSFEELDKPLLMEITRKACALLQTASK